MAKEYSQQEIYQAFGLEAPAQEPAAPAGDDQTGAGAQEQPVAGAAGNAGEQGQGIAAPVNVESHGDGQAQATAAQAEPGMAGTGEAPPQGNKEPLTPQQRRENAARRRQAETQAAIDAAIAQERQKQDAAMKEFFAQAKLKNTITGEPIGNMEQFRQWRTAFEQARISRDMKDGKLTPEGLAAVLQELPEMKKVQQLLDAQEQQRLAAEQAQAQSRIDAEIREIQKIDASIHSLEDLLSAPYGKQLYEMTQRGYSLSHAHYLLNREKLDAARQEKARQQVMVNNQGKEHLTATAGARGAGAVPVPPEELRIFRQFNPDATDAEIQAFYNRRNRNQ